MHELIRRFDLETYSPRGLPPRDITLNIGGQLVSRADWKDSSVNKTEGFERSLPPPALASAYLARNNPLATLDAWTGAEHAALDVPFDEFLRRNGASDEALRLIAVGNHAVTLKEMSALNELRKAYALKQESAQTVVFVRGGTARVTDAMRAALKSDLVLGQRVASIRHDAQGVQATTQTGEVHRARFAITTLPFSVLRGLRLDLPLSGPQSRAVRHLPYSEATCAILSLTAPFWESDGLPAAMWTDGLIELLLVLPTDDGKPRQLLAFLNGAADRRLRRIRSRNVHRYLEEELHRLRPASEGKVRVTHVQTWTTDPNALGAYAFFGPGQIRAFQASMALPAGRVHFAGEHTATRHAGMEGALESAERVAREVIARLS